MQPTYQQIAKDCGFELPKDFLSIEDYLKPYEILSRVLTWQAVNLNKLGTDYVQVIQNLKRTYVKIQEQAFDQILKDKHDSGVVYG